MRRGRRYMGTLGTFLSICCELKTALKIKILKKINCMGKKQLEVRPKS